MKVTLTRNEIEAALERERRTLDKLCREAHDERRLRGRGAAGEAEDDRARRILLCRRRIVKLEAARRDLDKFLTNREIAMLTIAAFGAMAIWLLLTY